VARPPLLHKIQQSRPFKKVRLREVRRYSIIALKREARDALASSLLGYEAVQINSKDYGRGYR
jgi:hypothetical protein